MSDLDERNEAEATFAASAASDPQAFIALYDLNFPRVYKYLRFRCEDPEACEELAAMVFEQALLNIRNYQPEGEGFGSWLSAIARNLSSQYLDALRNSPSFSLPVRDLDNLPAIPDPPKTDLLEAEALADLLGAIHRLEGQDRDLLALKFAAGLANHDIALLTGLNESKVAVILYQAVHKLRDGLGIEMPMDNQKLPDLFFEAIDTRRSEEGSLPEGLSAEEVQALEVAWRLEQAEFTPEARSISETRARLLRQATARLHPGWRQPWRILPPRLALLVWLGIALVLILLFSWLIPRLTP